MHICTMLWSELWCSSVFFVRFLVSELLSILNNTVDNSDLGLKCLAGKQRSVVLRDMPLTLTCSYWGVKPKTCGVQERSPGEGCGGAKTPANFFFFKFLPRLVGKYTKSIISQKLRIAQKKSFMRKTLSDKLQCFFFKFSYFWRNIFFV